MKTTKRLSQRPGDCGLKKEEIDTAGNASKLGDVKRGKMCVNESQLAFSLLLIG